jgi:hypothetical protein|tara:strand:- start:650 stop:937 length:288 start_codon:yes stop_codon:yes gene_type:complete
MIIETPYRANDTITIRTMAGEELVARFVSENATHLVITKPLALQASQQGIGLGPWTFTIDSATNIKLNMHSIVFVHKTEKDMASQYISATTGLTL